MVRDTAADEGDLDVVADRRAARGGVRGCRRSNDRAHHDDGCQEQRRRRAAATAGPVPRTTRAHDEDHTRAEQDQRQRDDGDREAAAGRGETIHHEISVLIRPYG